ncbi:formate hydrogenlyase [Candidatus Desantisbacteria bacterium CG_4_10_14_3_um_filter_40_18]|uniref:Formate hydrogenlyase n=1 Tax=Candidatus Desantisbacteria bacterium CG_4_10_14_3_um_filter_40_18 TaxID=1974544 RepID=A0A2M7P117_9BACT|nr:MAG: formate hydrogenlyase [Candidatus Desantisbacteria bacterium CG_4_10_14_3_um_filter_40_18]
MYPYIIEIIQIVVVLLFAPIFVGWIRCLKCWAQGRSAPGLLQPLRDIVKLFGKDIILAENASWIFRWTPYLVFGVCALAGGIIPILFTDLPLCATADVIALVALFTLSRFFLSLAGMDIGTAFGGVGSSREMTIASLAEPAMLMAIFTVSLLCQSTSLSQMTQVIIHQNLLIRPSMAFALVAFIMVAIAETGRIPVDNPATHLELTMIHEAIILEYSGRHLALIEWAGSLKLLLFTTIGIAVFFPWGIATTNNMIDVLMAIVSLIIKLGIVGIGIVLMETGLAKMRIFRVPEFLGIAFLFATLGMLSYFILE